MEKELARIETVTVEGPSTLRIRWRGKRATDVVNLSGWIATGGDILASLRDLAVFSRAAITNYGAAVGWDDGEGDLAIDAVHLSMLIEEQKPFGNNDVRIWQTSVRLSNNECAELLGVSLSTWNSYKADANIPQTVAIVLRAATRDPLVMQAHLRPRVAGRPRKAGGGEGKRGI
jgi:hypothetical protein